MFKGRTKIQLVWATLLYAVCAALSVTLTRFNGGFAMFWMATAAIVAVLLSQPRERWAAILCGCGLASLLVTGFLGLGWRAAGPMVVANLIEALVDALAIEWANRRYRTFTALGWAATTYCVGGFVAPLISGLPAALTMHLLTGHAFLSSLLEWTGAHAMGFITLFPLAGLAARSRVRRLPLIASAGGRRRTFGVLAIVFMTGIAVFGQGRVPMLFVPTMVLMYAVLLSDLAVSAVGMLMLLAIASAFTLTGRGPLAFVSPDRAVQFYFLQAYFASIALSIAPIGIMLERSRRAHARLAESEARYRALADFSTDIIMVTNIDGTIRFVSPSIRTLGEYEAEGVVGTHASEFIAESHREQIHQAHLDVLALPNQPRTVEFLAITEGKHRRWFESHLRAIVGADGSVDGVCSVIRDIGHRKRREDELRAVALTDPLTLLANRRAFEVLIGERPTEGYVALIDLDHFKRINDSFGHDCGDRVLRAFATAARAAVREDDLVARMGGEEFALFLPGASLAQARLICGRLTDAFAVHAAPHLPEDWRVTASVGLSVLDGTLGHTLKRADAALYRAKANGRDQLAIAA